MTLIGREVRSASVIMVLAATMITPPMLRLLFPRRHGAAVIVEETIAGSLEAVEAHRVIYVWPLHQEA